MSENERDDRCAEHVVAAVMDDVDACDHCPDPWNCVGETCRYGRVTRTYSF